MLRAHHYWLGSLALHIALGAALLWWLDQHTTQTTLQTQQTRIVQSAQVAQQAYLRRKVDTLKAMQELMERIDQAQKDGARIDEWPGDAPRERPDAQTPPAADVPLPQALQEAKALRDRIQRLEQQARAKELAEVLKIPQAQALDQVQQEDARKAPADRVADKADSTAENDPTATLERYQQEAQAALERRQRQAERQQQGTPVQTASQHSGRGSGGQGAGTGQTGAQGASGSAGAGDSGGGQGSGGGRGNGAGSNPAYARAARDGSGEGRQYERIQPPAPVARQDLRLGQGNALGAGGPLANRVVLDRWYLIGPFAAADKRALQTVYPPEMLVDLDGVYLGKGSRVLQWQYLSSARYPLIPPTPVAKGIYYGYTEIRSDAARDVWLGLGADDDAKLWLNGQLVWTSGTAFKPWYNSGGFSVRTDDLQTANLIEGRRLVHLKQGRNTVLFKLYNGILDVFMAVVVEPAGGP